MKYRWITPDREGRADFNVLEYWIEANDRIWREAREKAQELAKQMNVHSPAGEVRDPKMILANCFAGCIAENAIIFRLNSYAGESGKAVRARPTLFDKSKDNDQVDILVSNEERQEMPGVSIEVRSSYGAVQDNYKRYTQWFSIVGNYVSANKGRELVKDFYITVVFNFSQDTMYQKMVSGEPITLQLAAGCSREFLKKYGRIDSLKNKGAEYLVIKPLIKGLPVDAVMDQIFERLEIRR